MTQPYLFQSIHNLFLTHNRRVIIYPCLEISHEVLTFEPKISSPHGSYIGPSLHVQFCVSSELFWTCSRITHLPHSCFPLSNTIHNNIQYWRRPQLHPAIQQNMASISNRNKLHDMTGGVSEPSSAWFSGNTLYWLGIYSMPSEGRATMCSVPLSNWLYLVTGSSCQVTKHSLTASKAQLHSVTQQLKPVT